MPGSTTSRPRSSTRGKELGETIEALSTKADVKGRVKKKAADTKDSITETVYETKEIALEEAHAAQSAARDAVTDDTGSVKPRVPIAALSAAAVRSALWCGAAAGEPAPASTHRNQRTHGARSVGHLSCAPGARQRRRMAGVAQRIYLAAPARANGHHEAIGCHHTAVGHRRKQRRGGVQRVLTARSCQGELEPIASLISNFDATA
ncbi:MAG: hypothetical protein QOH91_2868 [Mycobacterium sp.]|nr:hypothetical protein [Mycobacterium sp.]